MVLSSACVCVKPSNLAGARPTTKNYGIARRRRECKNTHVLGQLTYRQYLSSSSIVMVPSRYFTRPKVPKWYFSVGGRDWYDE